MQERRGSRTQGLPSLADAAWQVEDGLIVHGTVALAALAGIEREILAWLQGQVEGG